MREEGVPVVILNAGNLLFKREQLKGEQGISARLTADLIMSAYNVMGCDAFNVGAYDLSLGIDYVLEKAAEASFPFLSANLAHRHGDLFFSPYVVKEVGGVRMGIFGLVDDDLKIDKIPGGHKIALRDPLEVAKAIVPELKEKGVEYVVLLTDMMGRSMRRVAQLGLPIDLMVGSHRKNQLSLPMVVHDTYITHLDRGGKSVGRLDLTFLPSGYGQALFESLRARGQRVRDAVHLNNFVQLLLDIPDHSAIGPMVRAVEQEISQAQREQISKTKSPEEGGCGKEYVGVEACVECHPGRHKVWSTTGHARAYQALVKQNRQYDEECVVCHLLAYECDKGKPDLKNIEAFANVQCESCHGPGDLHVQSRGEQPMVVGKNPTSICLRCHTPEKSEDSGFLAHVKKICAERR